MPAMSQHKNAVVLEYCEELSDLHLELENYRGRDIIGYLQLRDTAKQPKYTSINRLLKKMYLFSFYDEYYEPGINKYSYSGLHQVECKKTLLTVEDTFRFNEKAFS